MNHQEIMEEAARCGIVGLTADVARFAASIAKTQREADLAAIRTDGRQLVASCQQKAVVRVSNRLQATELVVTP